MMQPPWTEIGRLESDVNEIKNQLNQTAKSYEFHQVSSDVDRLQRTVQELNSNYDGLRFELETLKEEMRAFKDEE